MSRFGSTATFYYTSGDVLTSGTYVYLSPDVMPNYPFETRANTDRAVHTTKTGRKYSYQNYNLQEYTVNFSNLKNATREALKTMWDARPIFTFTTNSYTWGTFRFGEDSWSDSEIAFDLFDVAFTMQEDA